MSTKIILLIVGIVFLVGLVFFIQNKNANQNLGDDSLIMDNSQDVIEKVSNSDELMENEDEDPLAKPKYLSYSEENVGKIDTDKVVYFFYANWCPTCRAADPDILENESRIPDDTTVIRVNYNDPDTDDDEKALAKKYGITYQHTFVLTDKDGNELKKWNGGEFKELLENLN